VGGGPTGGATGGDQTGGGSRVVQFIRKLNLGVSVYWGILGHAIEVRPVSE
jgi:hypothetical protein